MNDSRTNTQKTTRQSYEPPIIITQTTLCSYDFKNTKDNDKDKRK